MWHCLVSKLKSNENITTNYLNKMVYENDIKSVQVLIF